MVIVAFCGVPCMAYIYLVKVHYTRKYLRSIREIQCISDVAVKIVMLVLKEVWKKIVAQRIEI